jgi:hypothetical protein
MSNALYVIHPSDKHGETFPIAVTRDGYTLNYYATVEDAYDEWADYAPVVWDSPLPVLGERLEFDPEAVTW